MPKKAHPQEIQAFRAGYNAAPGARCPYIETSDTWEFYQLGRFHRREGITGAGPTRTREKGAIRFTDLEGRRFMLGADGDITMTKAA